MHDCRPPRWFHVLPASGRLPVRSILLSRFFPSPLDYSITYLRKYFNRQFKYLCKFFRDGIIEMKEGDRVARPKTKTATQSKNEYNARNYERIALVVPKGQKDSIKAHAERRGESINGFVNRAITETIDRDNEKRTDTGEEI